MISSSSSWLASVEMEMHASPTVGSMEASQPGEVEVSVQRPKHTRSVSSGCSAGYRLQSLSPRNFLAEFIIHHTRRIWDVFLEQFVIASATRMAILIFIATSMASVITN